MSHHHCCSHQVATASVVQSLDELDFERGVWSAALSGEEARVQDYLQKRGDPDAMDSSGYTALHYAARNGHVTICRMLLNHGARVNAQTRSGGVTALHRAAYCGHTAVARLLLDRKANPSLLDTDGKTALHKAAEKQSTELVEMLLEKDPSILNLADNRGKKAMDYVKDGNHELQALLSKDAG